MNEYTFWNPTTEEEIDIEADGFEEASNIMFGEWEYDYKEWELHSVNGKM